ncbi:MAG: DNA mismatch repair protein MutS, partial [Candidatus Krumholzibacteria bacterium]|nr:DNA mismatch repair protein MutS [Candidatus Krumholzibacteria bacterium]
MTPLMSQYREIKNRYRDGILFFQVGDFYETFFEDAKVVSRILNITLTTRDKNKNNPVPLAGVPLHAADTYIKKLLQAGKKVVICDQVEDPAEAKGIVKRRVTDVITPGTTLEPATLTERENNFLISLVGSSDLYGFALLDLSTGEFSAGEETAATLENILAGFKVREAIMPEGHETLRGIVTEFNPNCTFEELEPYIFNERSGSETLLEHFKVENLSCFGLEEMPLATSAAGALLAHVKDLRQNDLRHITGLKLIVSDETLFLDRETIKNLEIFEPLWG